MTDLSADTPLLEVSNLAVNFRTMDGEVSAVRNAGFSLPAGKTLAIVGESGSGKSTTAMAVIGLLPGNGTVASGSIRFDGQELVGLPEAKMRAIRGRSIGLVPQDPMSNLNPVTKIGTQVAETLLVHGMATAKDVDRKVVEVLTAAGLPNAAERAKQYPHEFSGGMRQRALIAIGLACRPRLLIADEPTSALDVTVQRTILDQIDRMTEELGTSVLLITHDLGLAAERASELVVMHRGEVVETGPARQLLEDPQHPYTQSLVRAAPSVAAVRLRPGAFSAAGDAEESGAAAGTDTADDAAPDNIVEFRDLTKVFKIRGRADDFYAARNVTLDIPRGRTVAIVGESGSGKTTTARMLLKLIEPTSGTMTFDGMDVASLNKVQLRDFRQRVQPIFQDPYSSLDPMYTIERILEEPLKTYRRGNKAERQQRVRELMDQVALPQEMLHRYPAELSGGQRQRVAIARALALKPELIVCDEPVSALDVLVQAQILQLLGDLQREFGLSYLFISHDLAVVRLISDYVCVMKDGELVEAATSEEVFSNPRHPYTRRLLASIPGNELNIEDKLDVEGELAS
ncbi:MULTISPECIES: ABC transporter ATP-binding protein [unclassified Arthrobacter]|uniref:ABC transporter ATP-binding protein n=1 Tax=unclassified Arthrobacter TaxID=235627 RepID=UPI001D137969|nr:MULTISPECIES: ABC transporter ATP-binding protein [unclassified Arthrobacter]MCC3277454.1 ABC transporter ATP-binding protein [Arthrobacter sp. zg-Y20]MCC3277574.1 ABC transporter ATP-binding protein [Arthrobacter sp. zg-Y40]MCC9179169.1 ABC transporter ATP-binding protein [Arthrobacter sp. zg-Y750]MDK1317614.1 ABC transporter ATP-binding protein [Arthrobacter sp. zg.Y20]MDK1329178.1 ABC transporter ATP-binding protein [Arthrobacter sp. zg-Y1143]